MCVAMRMRIVRGVVAVFAHDTRGCSAVMDHTISQANAEEFVLKVKLSKAFVGGGRGSFVVVRQPHEIVTTTRSLVHLTNPFARSHRPFAVDRSEDRQVCAKAFLMSTSHPNFKFYAECSRSAGRRSQESAEVTFIVIALNNILYNHCYSSFHSTTLVTTLASLGMITQCHCHFEAVITIIKSFMSLAVQMEHTQ